MCLPDIYRAQSITAEVGVISSLTKSFLMKRSAGGNLNSRNFALTVFIFADSGHQKELDNGRA